MLLSQALVRLLDLWDHSRLDPSFDDLIKSKVTVVLCQILTRALQSLEVSQSAETASYAVITLTHLSSLPWSLALEHQVSKAIENGKCAVREEFRNHASPGYLWVEKVTYSSSILHRTYCLAALKATPSAHSWGDAVSSLVAFSAKDLAKFTMFFSRLPLFSDEPEWKLRTSLIEGYLFFPKLKRTRLNIFPRKDMAEDKYLEYIPFTWTTVNNRRETPMSADSLWDMMVLSMLNYQADEYMEAVVGEGFQYDLQPVREVIISLCKESRQPTQGLLESSPSLANRSATSITKKRPHEESNGATSDYPRKKPPINDSNGIEHLKATATEAIDEVSTTLSNFITHQTTHPLVQKSSPADRQNLLSSIQTFLLAHLTQIEDNARFSSLKSQPSYSSTALAQQKKKIIPYSTTPSSYFNWVRSTSAAHTSCPYSFAYLACLLGGAAAAATAGEIGYDGFQGAKQKYYAQALCGHLATMCRQYNDYGSVGRDQEEGNVNSVDFPEFHHSSVSGSEIDGEGDEDGEKEKEKGIKEAVLEIAGFERECLRLAQGRLDKCVGERVRGAVGVFVDVTDLYGQIYVARDIASRMK